MTTDCKLSHATGCGNVFLATDIDTLSREVCHHMHVWQFSTLATMTGDLFFAEFADSPAIDLPQETE